MANDLPSGAPVPGPGDQPAPSAAGPTEPVAPQQPPADTETKADIEGRIAELEAEHKRNISRLQSSLMSQQTKQAQTWEQEREDYERKLAEAYMSSMDEKERGEYERDLLRNRLSTMEQRLASERTQREQIANMNNYAQWFMSMGVPATKLDWSSPEALAQSGTEALTAHVQDLQSKLAAYARPAPAPAAAPAAPAARPAATPTPVVTQHGGTPATVATFEELRKSLSDQAKAMGRPELTDEDVFKLAERNPTVRSKLNEIAQADAERRALARG